MLLAFCSLNTLVLLLNHCTSISWISIQDSYQAPLFCRQWGSWRLSIPGNKTNITNIVRTEWGGQEFCQKNAKKVCQQSLNTDPVIELEADFAVKWLAWPPYPNNCWRGHCKTSPGAAQYSLHCTSLSSSVNITEQKCCTETQPGSRQHRL